MAAITPSRAARWAAAVLAVSLLLPGGAAAASLADSLRDLASANAFRVSGLDRLGDAEAPAVQGSSALQRVKRLLKDYDYVIVHAAPGRIGRLIVLGHKHAAPTPPPSKDIVLPTRRQGEHHFVHARIQGNAGHALETELMVDTGASLVVLPQSRAAALGQSLEGLPTRTMKTTNGTLQARVGHVTSVSLGAATVTDVEVAFVPDQGLGNSGLLGMNVLSRFVFVVDDEHNQLTLIPDDRPKHAPRLRPPGAPAPPGGAADR
jgi:clan AA aspartic protease (TIGR02281 family)